MSVKNKDMTEKKSHLYAQITLEIYKTHNHMDEWIVLNNTSG